MEMEVTVKAAELFQTEIRKAGFHAVSAKSIDFSPDIAYNFNDSCFEALKAFYVVAGKKGE